MTIGHYNVQIAVISAILMILVILSLIIGPDVILWDVLSKMHLC